MEKPGRIADLQYVVETKRKICGVDAVIRQRQAKYITFRPARTTRLILLPLSSFLGFLIGRRLMPPHVRSEVLVSNRKAAVALCSVGAMLSHAWRVAGCVPSSRAALPAEAGCGRLLLGFAQAPALLPLCEARILP
jgi:hypothetical protein